MAKRRPKPLLNHCTAREAALALDVSLSRVHALCQSEELKAIKFGTAWMIDLDSVNRLKDEREAAKQARREALQGA